MKKFSILEAQSREYGGGTPFSNGHRSKKSGGFLENWHYLVDLDVIIYDNDSVKVIIEKKFKLDSKNLGNILTDKDHFQKKMLLNLCRKLGAKLFVNVVSEKKYFEILDNTSYKEWSNEVVEKAIQKYFCYDSDDSVFIEFRNSEPQAIMKRIQDQINVDGLLINMSNRLNCEVYKIDDMGKDIKFFDFKGNLIGAVNHLQNPQDRPLIENEWKQVYQKMNLW